MSSQPQTSEEQSTAAALPREVETDKLPRALFGYERSAIVELLDTMSARIRDLVHERAERERRIGELEQQLDRSLDNQRLIGETLVKARQEAEEIHVEALRSAEQELQAAREQAERIVAEAELAAGERAAAMIAKGQEERQALIDEARRERETLLQEAGRARTFVEETHEQLSDFLMAAVRWYEQAKPAAERGNQLAREPESPSNESSSMPSDLTAALMRESQSTPSSIGRSEE